MTCIYMYVHVYNDRMTFYYHAHFFHCFKLQIRIICDLSGKLKTVKPSIIEVVAIVRAGSPVYPYYIYIYTFRKGGEGQGSGFLTMVISLTIYQEFACIAKILGLRTFEKV